MSETEQVAPTSLEKLIESHMQFMAKIYATDVMMLRRLILIFEQQQKGAPLTQEEIDKLAQAHIEHQTDVEKTVLDDLHRYLDDPN